MSIKALDCAMALRGVTPSEKLLLLALANYADENMQCFPSQKRLADDTCLTERTIRTLLAGLEERRIISRKARQRADHSRATDLVTLHFYGEVSSDGILPVPEMVSAPPEAVSGGGEMTSGGPGKSFRGVPEMVSGLTTFEPSSEPSVEPSLGPAAPPTTKKRGSRRVPDDWSPSAKTYNQLCDEGHHPGDLERCLTRMRDHEFRTPRSDWDATFRNWVRQDADRKPRQANARSDQPPHDAKLAAREANLARAFAGSELAAGLRGRP